MKKSGKNMDWSPENVEILSKMWHSGFTARHIAQKLGQGATRNAVIGKAHRLGLSQRPVSVAKQAIPLPVALGVMHSCQWPYGDKETNDAHYCGKPVKAGKSYCEEHCQIAYRPLHGEGSVSGAMRKPEKQGVATKQKTETSS